MIHNVLHIVSVHHFIFVWYLFVTFFQRMKFVIHLWNNHIKNSTKGRRVLLFFSYSVLRIIRVVSLGDIIDEIHTKNNKNEH